MVHLPTALFSLSYIRDSSNRCSHYAPLRGATVVTRTVTEGAAEFQSTRPMRGATGQSGAAERRYQNFNPRAPRGARQRLDGVERQGICISIHAPLAGRDRRTELRPPIGTYFNPRAPCGARRGYRQVQRGEGSDFNPRAPCGARLIIDIYKKPANTISIHAPHAGRDYDGIAIVQEGKYFNPRAPCGARPASPPFCGHEWPFQSTRPMRGATDKAAAASMYGSISIHAPHAGRDLRSKPPCLESLISIHAPHAGRDDVGFVFCKQPSDFNPRAPCGARPFCVSF